jgi:hypothetical protein
MEMKTILSILAFVLCTAGCDLPAGDLAPGKDTLALLSPPTHAGKPKPDTVYVTDTLQLTDTVTVRDTVAIEAPPLNGITVAPVAGDDYAYLQGKINYCIVNNIKNMYFTYGEYQISRPLLVEDPGKQVTLNLIGNNAAHFDLEVQNPKIVCTFSDGFAIGYQLGRSSLIKGLVIYGTGRGTDTRFNAYSAISIDPYYRGTTSGSSAIIIEDCRIRGFTNGITISQNGVTLNGENIHVRDCSIDGVRNAYVTCQRQSKENTVKDLIVWDNVETVFNGMDYGSGLGNIPYIDGANIAGTVYQVFKFQYQDFATSAQKIFAESIHRIGSIVDGGVGVTIRDSHFEFPNYVFDYPHFKGNNITWDNCSIRYYDGLNNKRVVMEGVGNTYLNGYTDIPFLSQNSLSPQWVAPQRLNFYSNYKAVPASKTRVVVSDEMETFYWLDQQYIDVENKRCIVNRWHNAKVGDYLDGGHPFVVFARVAAVSGDTLFLDCIKDGLATQTIHLGLSGLK